ncbi:topless-related protein 1 [Neltuma alba]|uniref:topless-related protein 1 n=1 Tax=Neltuma alba TaxID=207710 RepID=UPI0010A59E0B|nr:topless-related protein 1-like [Prosopis alba]XP_028798249.1 topless-related protein 1-like [Prosopis alba]XP_028798250.1 topless-related protein 1-like [Prosopis alba]XP_028798251.1 topless-related protein 1-like [Prosopis alba]XP_028798252.1 topless-related protein 1-like [Prosopis alba]
MSSLKKEIIFLILQFCEEEGFKETVHMLERESGCYFDKKHFEDMVLAGKFEDAETYLSCFTTVDDNRFSTKIYFELRKQKFLEALDTNDRSKALDILMKDVKVFAPGHEDLLKEMTQLLTINNIREHESLSNYQDTNSVRKIVLEDLKTIIEENPLLNGKLKFPAIKSQRLSSLLSQSLNWQHLLCKHPIPEPVIQTLFVDHVCKLCSDPSNPVNSDDCGPSTVTDSSLFPTANESSEASVKVLEDPNQILKGESCKALNEVTSSAVKSYLPRKVVLTLNDDSPPTSMDFHPTWHTVLLVGTQIGNLGIWDVASGEKLLFINFEVWDIGACSPYFKEAIEKDLWISVNKVIWSSDGSLFGVAFSKHLVQLYSYNGGVDICQHLEIEAHRGNVNDIAFSFVREQLLVITCGDDKAVKVWDADTGERFYVFGGHNAPVCSICPHVKENVHFIFSTSIDGKIKAWLYDTMGPRVDYDAPGCGYTKLAYSTNDQRLFSCGVGKDGEPFLVEWDESEGYIKRVYEGLKAPCSSKIQFDTTRNQFLVAGDDHMVKYWDMDNVQLLASTNAEGGLLEYPCIRFNKEGRLLAVAASENKIKILEPDYDVLLMQNEAPSIHAPTVLSETSAENENKEVLEGMNTNLTEEDNNSSKFWKIFKISEPSQCQFMQLPVHPKVNKIVRLIYTSAGNAILALASDGINVLWKWPGNEQATSQVSPHLWQPRNGSRFMSNDLGSVKPEESIGCFAISKNDSYLISASGGLISLFNMLTFKTMTTFMSPPPKATSISFYPQDNNVLAIGFDDSSIFIYNVRTCKVIRKLKGHSTRVTSLAFSNTLHVLVSAEVNNQICLWNIEGWEKVKGRNLQIPAQRKPEVPSDTHIQFHPEQINFLVVQDSHLAIYEAQELTCIKQWVPVLPLVISQAVFSSDGTDIYAGFVDGTITIFDGLNLQPLCKIDPTAYLPHTSSESISLLAMAANPVTAGQFAVGLSDGNVYVMEPPEPGPKWPTLARDDKEAAEPSGVGVV